MIHQYGAVRTILLWCEGLQLPLFDLLTEAVPYSKGCPACLTSGLNSLTFQSSCFFFKLKCIYLMYTHYSYYYYYTHAGMYVGDTGSGRDIALIVRDLDTRWKWVVTLTPWLLNPRYPLNRRLSGPQTWSQILSSFLLPLLYRNRLIFIYMYIFTFSA